MAFSTPSQPPDAASWSDLPGDVLGTVASLLPSLFDLLRFRSVCRSWKSAAAAATCAQPRLPCLMFSEKRGADGSAHCCFYSLSDGRVHRVRLPKEAVHWRCCGESHGWLAMVLHVVTGPETDNYYDDNGIYGRPADTSEYTYPWYVVLTDEGDAWRRTAEYLRDDFVHKVVASPPGTSSDDPSGCTVVMFYDVCKVYAKPGDEAWTSLSFDWYDDLAHYEEDKFYLLMDTGGVDAVDFAGATGGPPRIEEYVPYDTSDPRLNAYGQYLYFSVAGREIILVGRLHPNEAGCPMQTERFHVSMLEDGGVDSGRRRWVAAASLGGGALFLGNGCSTWVSCAQTGGSEARCAADCIYFVADDMEDQDSDGVLQVGVNHV